MIHTKTLRAKYPRPADYRTLLNFENAKTSKGEKLGYLTGILYLAPANEAGRANVCACATTGCKNGCLFRAGRASFQPNIVPARIAKTHFLFDNREAFLASLRHDIARAIIRARKLRLKLSIRVNGTSDLAWLALMMAAEFPFIQFYDYTKLPKAYARIRPNYHLTFSHSETNEQECKLALAHGLNVAVVFSVKRGKPLPQTFMGSPVIDGDMHDLRFLDGYKGSVIGLRAKGPAKKDCSGFVVRPPQLVTIQLLTA